MLQNELLFNSLFIYILLESYEIYWQNAKSVMGMLAKMHYYYSKNILLFLLMQPTFYFAIGFAMLTDLNASALVLLFIKTVDVATKILLIEQVFIKKEITTELMIALLKPIYPLLPYLGLIIYPALIFITLY
ncbi:MAG: hypothetical protein WBK95_01335 [Sulfurimonas sp.]|nr:hypothetical protein [Sulfurimonas sp.]MDD3059624.1 hypothetical protein [Sulfurimonas sp.]MDD5201817.1 hypothetical protein [Sulfurimonas sp.]